LKRTIAALLMLILCVFLLVGCSRGSNDSGSNDGGSTSSSDNWGDDDADETENASALEQDTDVGELATLDLYLLTVGYPSSAEVEDDWAGESLIKDKKGRYEISFGNYDDAGLLNGRRGELMEYKTDDNVTYFAEFEQKIGGMSDVFCIKFNSYIRNGAAYLVTFPKPIKERVGTQIEVKVWNTDYKIDDVLALASVQAILNSITFK